MIGVSLEYYQHLKDKISLFHAFKVSAWPMVAHVILVSAQVLSVLALGLWTLDFGLGLDNWMPQGLMGSARVTNLDG